MARGDSTTQRSLPRPCAPFAEWPLHCRVKGPQYSDERVLDIPVEERPFQSLPGAKSKVLTVPWKSGPPRAALRAPPIRTGLQAPVYRLGLAAPLAPSTTAAAPSG